MNRPERALLDRVARQAMLDYGFEPDYPQLATAQAEALTAPAADAGGRRDPRHLLWSSIDNPESRDLDQIEVVEDVDGGTRLLVGIADVAGAVPPRSPIDEHAGHNTTTVYTGVHTFAMLPSRMSYDLTSLGAGQPRRIVVIQLLIRAGELAEASIYPALAVNQAKLAYPTVSEWLDGGSPPEPLAGKPELQRQLRLQAALADELAQARRQAGALDFETAETRPVLNEQGEVVGLERRGQDRAGAIIEELMIAANQAVVRELDRAGLPSVLRVVRQPEHWDQIVAYAAARGSKLPSQPDSAALAGFLERMKRERASEFHEISLALIKLIGRGEYVAHRPGEALIGHFGLATNRYGHATAPNRRYADLATQRLLAPLLKTGSQPYAFEQVQAIAGRCSWMEKQAEKVERRVRKSIAAALLSDRIGQPFQGIVTKARPEGTFIHVFHPPVEGMIVRGAERVRVGDKVRARLVHVDVERSYIDFEVRQRSHAPDAMSTAG